MTIRSNNSFFQSIFRDTEGVEVSAEWCPIISLTYGGETYKIHCPSSSNYVVNLDVVDQAIDLDVDVLAYSDDWQTVLEGAKEYSKNMGILLLEYRQVIGLVKNGAPLT